MLAIVPSCNPAQQQGLRMQTLEDSKKETNFGPGFLPQKFVRKFYIY